MCDRNRSFFYPQGWDPAVIQEIERTGAYRRPDQVKVPIYNRYFTDEEFRRVLGEVTAFINAKLQEKGYDFTLHEAELATNILSEGLDQAIASGGFRAEALAGGYESFGIDTFMERYRGLKSWLPERLIRIVEASNVVELAAAFRTSYSTLYTKDEQLEIWRSRTLGRRPYSPDDRGSGLLTQGRTNDGANASYYYTLEIIDLELGMYANAAMFAQGMATAARDIPGFAELDTEARFFWSTMYYNAGAGTARKVLETHGVDYHAQSFAGSSDPKRSAQYHAIKRMSSLGYLLRTVYAVH